MISNLRRDIESKKGSVDHSFLKDLSLDELNKKVGELEAKAEGNDSEIEVNKGKKERKRNEIETLTREQNKYQGLLGKYCT